MPTQFKLIIAAIVLVVVLVIVLSISPFTVIQNGEVGVITRNGKFDRVLDSGLHAKTPVLEHVTRINIQVQKEQTDADAASKDLQKVNATVAVNYMITEGKVEDLFVKIGTDYKSKVIDPAVQEAVKAATAQYTAEELITKRPEVTSEIKASLVSSLSGYDLTVKGVSIINFAFSEGFNTSIEEKVKAEQNALTAKNLLEQKKYEAEQTVVTAEATAKSTRLISDAANNEKYIQLKQLEVQMKFAERWNGALPTNLYGSAPIPFLQIGGN